MYQFFLVSLFAVLPAAVFAQEPTATSDAMHDALKKNMEDSLGLMYKMGGGKGTLPGMEQQEQQDSSRESAEERARREIEESDEPDFVKDAKRLLLDMSGGAAGLMRKADKETSKIKAQPSETPE